MNDPKVLARDPRALGEIDTAIARAWREVFDETVERTLGEIREALAARVYDAVVPLAIASPDWSEDGVDGWYAAGMEVEYDGTSPYGISIALDDRSISLTEVRRIRDVFDTIDRRARADSGESP